MKINDNHALTTPIKNSKKEDIVLIAAHHFLKYGYEKTVISEILIESKIATSLIYYYFDGKADLALEIFKYVHLFYEKNLFTVVNENFVNSEQRANCFINTLYELFSRNPDWLLLAYDFNSIGLTKADKLISKHIQRWTNVMTLLIESIGPHDLPSDKIAEISFDLIVGMMLSNDLKKNQTQSKLRIKKSLKFLWLDQGF